MDKSNKKTDKILLKIFTFIAIFMFIYLIFIIIFGVFLQYDVKYVGLCIRIIAITLTTIIQEIAWGNKKYSKYALIICIISLLPLIYYYVFSCSIEGKLYLMKKHNIPYKDLTVERQDLYSESLFYTDSLPHYRTVIINGYCLAYIDGKWKEVTCDFRNPNSTYGYGYDDDGNLEFYEYNDDD